MEVRKWLTLLTVDVTGLEIAFVEVGGGVGRFFLNILPPTYDKIHEMQNKKHIFPCGQVENNLLALKVDKRNPVAKIWPLIEKLLYNYIQYTFSIFLF